MKIDKNRIQEKSNELKIVAAQLKSEFFGIDDIIDKVIVSINAWYTLPEIITRPVIVNLWGLTGVGKTQLVRRLVSLIGFEHLFIEVQMDGATSSNSNKETTILKLFESSSIEEGEPGIILLDEFQRYRTVDQDGNDEDIERFQDVWMLLSDGKFPASSSLFAELEMLLAQEMYSEDSSEYYKKVNEQDEDEEERESEAKRQKLLNFIPRKFSLYPTEAQRLKKNLKLTETIQEIMQFSKDKIATLVETAIKEKAGKQTDYSKTLIFISGNLDEAFTVANSVNDCDTDADIFYAWTSTIDVTKIKKALTARFKPEQIARFGNNHIIYPSISRSSYEKIIKHTVDKYCFEMSDITDINFTVQQPVLEAIYNNSVYPAQGTRPVFSSVHKIFSDALMRFAYWGIQGDFAGIDIDIDLKALKLIGTADGGLQLAIPVELDITSKKEKTNIDFNTMVAVHESGHALVYALLKKTAPKEVKINTATYKGGYMIKVDNDNVESYQELLDNVAVLFAGTEAEKLVFGQMHVSTGAHSDIITATQIAANIVRQFGFIEGFPGSVSGVYQNNAISTLLSLEDTDKYVKRILDEARAMAKTIIKSNLKNFSVLVERLLVGDTITQEQFIELFKGTMDLSDSYITTPYKDKWDAFKQHKVPNIDLTLL